MTTVPFVFLEDKEQADAYQQNYFFTNSAREQIVHANARLFFLDTRAFAHANYAYR